MDCSRLMFMAWVNRATRQLRATGWRALFLAWAATAVLAATAPPPNARSHWAFQSPGDPLPPTVRDQGWVKTEIDAFILAKLEAAGVDPAPAADPRTLIRRMSFDLLGLPPTSDE